MNFILHNSQDANSRAFVDAFGSTEGFTVLDWYAEHPPDQNKFEYEGPPPRTFPSVSIASQNTVKLFELPADIESCLAEGAVPTSIAPGARFIGGMTIGEAKRLISHPFFPNDHKALMSAKLSKVRPIDEPAVQFQQGLFSDPLLDAEAKVELIKFFPLIDQHSNEPQYLIPAWSTIKSVYGSTWCTDDVISRVETLAAAVGIQLIP